MAKRNRHSVRTALTLLEVLIAMGVLGVGILSIAALLPVANYFMAEGAKFDRSAAASNVALNDSQVRSLIDPPTWWTPVGNGLFGQLAPPAGTALPTYPPGITLSTPFPATYNYQFPALYSQAIPAPPFIIDPLACSYTDNLAANQGAPGSTTFNSGPHYFPPLNYCVVSSSAFWAPTLARVTFERNGPSLAPNGFKGFMPFRMAERMFVASDDLIFDIPSTADRRTFAPNGISPDFSGDYSWLAVASYASQPWHPGPDMGWGAAGIDDNQDLIVDELAEAGWPGSDDLVIWKTAAGNQWTVSVVVCYKRNLQLSPPTVAGSPRPTPPERMVYVAFTSAPLPMSANPQQALLQAANAGLSGGDAILYLPTTSSTASFATKDWLDVKPNQWIMVSAWPNMVLQPQNYPYTINTLQGSIPQVKWYRIVATDDAPYFDQTVNTWARHVTLAGSDWNAYKYYNALGISTGYQTAYATIVDGAVAVFETTLEAGM